MPTPDKIMKFTEEHKRKISESKKGSTPWSRGKKFSDSYKKKISIGTKRAMDRLPDDVKQKIRTINKGRVFSEEVIRRRAKTYSGIKHHNWKGGITPINTAIRHSFEYKIWRKSVFEKDNYTCGICCKRGVKLNAHHILGFANYPELRFAINNGLTLCNECHNKAHMKGVK